MDRVKANIMPCIYLHIKGHHVDINTAYQVHYHMATERSVQSNLSKWMSLKWITHLYIYIHTHPFSGPFSGTTQVSRYQKGKTDLDFTEARDSEWQWHQLGCMQVCNSLQTDNHASTPPLHFLQAGCPTCRPTNSVKALKDSGYPFKWITHLNGYHLSGPIYTQCKA